MRTRYKFAIGGGVMLAALLAAGPIVREAATRAAEARGAAIHIESVRPAWLGVKLEGVDVRLEGVKSASIHLDSLRVTYGRSGRQLSLRGGDVRLRGDREQVTGELLGWRDRHRGAAPSSPSGERSGEGPRIEGLRVDWRASEDDGAERLSATGLSLEQRGGGLVIDADFATGAARGSSVDVTGLHVELGRRETSAIGIRVLTASSIEADATLKTSELEPTARPLPAPAPTVLAKAPAPAIEGKAKARGVRLRDRLLRYADLAHLALLPNATLRFDRVSGSLHLGDDTLTVGPGQLTVSEADGRVAVRMVPGSPSPTALASDVLTFKASIPVGGPKPDASGDIRAEIDGGPIWLSTLGLREGDFGLLDVAQTSLEAHATLTLSGDASTLSLSGSGKLHGLSIKNRRLAPEPVRGLELAWSGKAEASLDGSRLKVEDGELDLGALRLLASGTYLDSPNARSVDLAFEVPLTPCQTLLDSIPQALTPKLVGLRLAGSFGIRGKLKFSSAAPDRDFLAPWSAANTCRITEAPASISVANFARPFHHTIYDASGNPTDVMMGPTTPGWTSYGGISKFMEVALMTTEDGGFHRHHGFDEEAIRNSIRENLREGRFVRGASTLSMQLAKNLYLGRDKNISRKLQEAILTMYLEQELTKQQIVELYLNVVEFGPMLYGIGPAARHYFAASPSQLSLAQALYISSILPNPKRQHFGQGGKVSPQYLEYLRKLMEIAYKRHRISDQELEDGLREEPAFGRPGPGSAAGPPLHYPLDEPDDDADDWLAP